jgi:uncharacterized membrane-anchored protein
LRVIIVVVQVGAMKIYVAAVEALRKKKDRMKPSLSPIITKISGKTSLGLSYLALKKFHSLLHV